MLLPTAATALAADTYWNGAIGTPLLWLVPGNWTAGLPTISNVAYIANDGTATIGLGESPLAGTLKLGLGNFNEGGGNIVQSGGSLTAATLTLGGGCSFPSGAPYPATYTLNGGALTVTGPLNLGGGYFNPGGGSVVQTGGTLTTMSLYLSAGVNPVTGLPLAANYSLSDGLLASGMLQIYSAGTHLFQQTGGTVSLSSGGLYLSALKNYTTGDLYTSRYDLSAGLLAAPTLKLAGLGNSIFQQTGGQATLTPGASGQADQRVTIGESWSGGEYSGNYQLYAPGN